MCYRLILLLSALVCLLGAGGVATGVASGGVVQVADAEPVSPLELTPEERAWIAAHPRIVLGIDQDWACLLYTSVAPSAVRRTGVRPSRDDRRR